jgi:hypothetical protein
MPVAPSSTCCPDFSLFAPRSAPAPAFVNYTDFGPVRLDVGFPSPPRFA